MNSSEIRTPITTPVPEKLIRYLRSLSSDSFRKSPWVSRNNSLNDTRSYVTPPSKSHTSLSNTPRTPVIPADFVTCQLEEEEAPEIARDIFPSQVILSICWSREKLGVSFYDPVLRQVYTIEDQIESAPDFVTVRSLFNELRPKAIIMGGRQDERLFNTVQELREMYSHQPTSKSSESGSRNEHSGEDEATSSGGSNDLELYVLPASDFKYDICRRKVLFYRWPGLDRDAPDAERESWVRSAVNLECEAAVRSLGGLLRYLDQKINDILPVDISDRNEVILGLQTYKMEAVLHVDEATLKSLQVFSEDFHPAAMKRGKMSSSKEGLSLFSLLNKTSSPLSTAMLRRILLKPIRDGSLLKKRFDDIEWALNPTNYETIEQIQSCLKNVASIPTIMSRLQRCQMNLRDWKIFYKSLFNIVLITEISQSQDQNVHMIKEITQSSSMGIYQAMYLIQRTLNFEQAEREGRFVVMPGLDRDLDEKKMKKHELPEILSRVGHSELNYLPSHIDSCCVIYLPHIGFLLAIPISAFASQSNNTTDTETMNFEMPGLQMMFRLSDMVLYKSELCCGLDQEFGDLEVVIANHETSIMIKLVDVIMQQSSNLITLVTKVLTMDVFIGFSRVVRDMGWVKPKITTTCGVRIIRGRHPLQELCTGVFVANDTDGYSSPLTIITGPNGSGKSVYIKQIAIIMYLVHIGCYGPADSIEFSPFDSIISVFQTSPSVTSGLSPFMADLNRLTIAMARSTSSSLLLIDQFGVSTYENDGSSLLASCLDFWLEQYYEPINTQHKGCPLIFVSTHMLKLDNTFKYFSKIKFVSMDIIRDGESVIPLYQIVNGISNNDLAFHVASVADIPENIRKRASEIKALLSKSIIPSRWDLLEEDGEKERCMEIVSHFLEFDLQNKPLGDLVSSLLTFMTSDIDSTREDSSTVCATPATPADPAPLNVNKYFSLPPQPITKNIEKRCKTK